MKPIDLRQNFGLCVDIQNIYIVVEGTVFHPTKWAENRMIDDLQLKVFQTQFYSANKFSVSISEYVV